jgi:hypothetical protein
MFYKVVYLTLAMFFLSGVFMPVRAQVSDPIVILVEPNGKNMVYKIDSKRLTLPGLFDLLGDLIVPRGRDASIIVVASESASISILLNLEMIIEKVGFGNIRYFYFGDDRRMMAELQFVGPAIPFSTKPNVLGANRDVRK